MDTGVRAISKSIDSMKQEIHNGECSNNMMLKYFAALSVYYYHGGTKNIIAQTWGIADANVAKTYVFAGEIKLRIDKSLRDTMSDIFGIGTASISIAISKISKFVNKNGIELKYDKQRNVLFITNKLTKLTTAKKLDNWCNCHELENVIANFIISVYDTTYNKLEAVFYNYIGRFNAQITQQIT